MLNRTLIFTLFALTQLTPQELPPRTITIIGAAEQSLLADKVTFTFSVVGLGSSLRLAVDDAKAKTDKIIRSLAAVGVPISSLQTEEFMSGENWDKAFLSSARDFKASVKTVVTLDSLELLEPAILALSDHKPEGISNITFELSDLEQRRRETQLAAVKDAKVQATKIMTELGVSIKNPLIVETYRGDAPPRPVYPAQLYVRGGRAGEVAYDMDGSSTTAESFIGAKKIVVKEVVRVVFQY